MTASVAVVLAALAPAANAEPARPLPVPYGATALATAELGPDVDPPGSNDWTCRPSAEHPNPVVLVHGLLASRSVNWQTMSPLLANAGYCVFALTYGRVTEVAPLSHVGGLRAMESSAAELGAFVDRVREATGADKIDLVGHSEGTVMPQYWLQFLGGAAQVDKYVAVTPLYRGTLADPLPVALLADGLGIRPPLSAAVAAACASCPQFISGSDYLDRMNAQPGGAAVPGVTYTTVMTRYDELVVPYTSGRLDAPNATNVVVQDGCEIDLSDHLSIITTPRTGQIILNALDPAHAVKPPCGVSLPALGGSPVSS
ncbi:esterase/lipase family protein [Pseudonocardia sp. GCM10023141]|uniref:esterase/lipase family protein n=1 Tax=Pseudonocardia sp. GCM10023141 TaxID=3252653 RepID=UPI00361D4896